MAKISIGLSESKILSSSMWAERLLIFSEANLKPLLDGRNSWETIRFPRSLLRSELNGRRGSQLHSSNLFAKLLYILAIPVSPRWSPPLFRYVEWMPSWRMKCHCGWLQNFRSLLLTSSTSPLAERSYLVTSSDIITWASVELSISLARLTMLSAISLGDSFPMSLVPACKMIWSGFLSSVGLTYVSYHLL